MKITTKTLDLEIEPKLLTEDRLKMIHRLLVMALEYEREKMQLDAAAPTRIARPVAKAK